MIKQHGKIKGHHTAVIAGKPADWVVSSEEKRIPLHQPNLLLESLVESQEHRSS